VDMLTCMTLVLHFKAMLTAKIINHDIRDNEKAVDSNRK
jgi:hypothetical protein